MIAEVLGRFHPLIVHLPIGIISLVLLMELASRSKRYNHIKSAIPFILLMGILSSMAAIFTGWIMPKAGEFKEELISLHLWFSVAMTSMSILAYISYRSKNDGLNKLYFPSLVLASLFLIITGHYGGSLTHGEGHFTKHLHKGEKKQVTDVNNLLVYQDIIFPILKQKCISCHNNGKQKGGLNMANQSAFIKGGDNGPSLVNGNSKSSLMIQRILLPIGHDEHMPPDGKKQITTNELTLLKWWIDEGLEFKNKVGVLKQSEEVKEVLKLYEQSESSIVMERLETPSDSKINQLKASGFTVSPTYEGSSLFYISSARDKNISKGKLNRLKSIKDNIVGLDLSGSSIDNGMIKVLSRMKNLQELRLQNTGINNKTIKRLETLPNLQYLNLYNTRIDGEALKSITKLKALKSLYIWQTDISEEVVEKFQQDHPTIEVNYKIDDSIFGDAQLMPPKISSDKVFFEDSMSVAMEMNYKNVNIYYTLDGSQPDTSSLKYEGPVKLDKTTLLKTISYKGGWITSNIAEQVFTKVGHPIQNLKLDKAPNEKYKAEGARSLYDLEKGSTSFTDGFWLGYYGEDVLATIDLGEQKNVSSVVVSALEDTGSYIFFPKSIEVRLSMDGKRYSKTKEISIRISQEPKAAHLQSFLVEFEEQDCRFIQLKVLGTLKNPEWHAAPGAKNWVFLDEIIIN